MNQPQNRAPLALPRNPARAAERGFTLVEIMVVIVILGLLATLVVPNVISMGDEAKVEKARTDCVAIYNAAKVFRMKHGKPPKMEELTTPDEKGYQYIENITVDPWDNEYQIRETERNNFEVISLGPDRTEGTEDDISSQIKKSN